MIIIIPKHTCLHKSTFWALPFTCKDPMANNIDQFEFIVFELGFCLVIFQAKHFSFVFFTRDNSKTVNLSNANRSQCNERLLEMNLDRENELGASFHLIVVKAQSDFLLRFACSLSFTLSLSFFLSLTHTFTIYYSLSPTLVYLSQYISFFFLSLFPISLSPSLSFSLSLSSFFPSLYMYVCKSVCVCL